MARVSSIKFPKAKINTLNFCRSFVVFIAIFVLTYSLSFSRPNIDVSLVLRYDDYSNDSPLHLEKALFETICAYNIKLTVGIIPFSNHINGNQYPLPNLKPLSIEKIKLIKEFMAKGNIEIALHGFTRLNNRKGFSSEFFGVNYNKQYEMIMTGKDYLEKTFNNRIVTFISPRNTFDLNTILVLEALEFETLSTDAMPASITRQLITERPMHIKILPSTCSLKDLRSILKRIRENNKSDKDIIAVLFHSYDFWVPDAENDQKQVNNALKEFKKILDAISNDKTIKSKFIREIAAEEGNRLTIKRFVEYSKYR